MRYKITHKYFGSKCPTCLGHPCRLGSRIKNSIDYIGIVAFTALALVSLYFMIQGTNLNVMPWAEAGCAVGVLGAAGFALRIADKPHKHATKME